MSKYFQFVIIIFYTAFFVGGFFVAIGAAGMLHKPVRDTVVFMTIAVWLLCSFSVAGLMTDGWLLFREVRRPVREEEQRIRKCLDKIQERAGRPAKYSLRIQEEKGPNSFAIGPHTIVVTSGALEALADDELTAILAHGFGHLQTNDGTAAMAFACTDWLPGEIHFFSGKIGAFACRRSARYFLSLPARMSTVSGLIRSLIRSLILAVMTGWMGWRFHIFRYLLATIAFIMLTWIIRIVFRRLWLLNCRQSEYRQDEFVHGLGLGPELRKALLKIGAKSPGKINFLYLLASTHPLVPGRVRRLERLEAHRAPAG
ncbi:MAG: M48 family metalloprotease [Puia sp.]|nr:M48 family metalloprotease [Puia sp.]